RVEDLGDLAEHQQRLLFRRRRLLGGHAVNVLALGERFSAAHVRGFIASGFTQCGGASPRAIAMAVSAHSSAILARPLVVALPRCGMSTTFVRSASPGARRGSSS